ncbi:TPA: ERF family protein [Streptococcus suis]|nr:ERF family protein [Streptococcus suis]HEL1711837.1 ERF family protein [Streptococcus suis]HEL2420937.1 ERF family protein [Streptococcus suis]HEL2452000.1 ERF family protein [Streptococcus suis]HEL2453910.1 ERF family protein [Streptococcus suis]
MAETLRKKLLNIQRDLKAPKGQYNNFGKYSYRNAEDIMEALKPLLVDTNTVCYCQDDYIEQIGGRYYLVATIVFADVETDNAIVVKARAREEENKKGMDGSQITGSASSYARKYALSGLFLIDDNKDADSNEYQQQNNQKQGANKNQQPPQQEQAQYITNEQYTEIVGWIRSLAQSLNKPFDEVEQGYLNHYRITNFHQVPVEHFNTVVHHIKSQVDKYKQPQNDFNNL